MARLDTAIERLYRASGLELVLQTGTIPFVKLHRNKVDILRNALSTPQVVAAIAEILPPAMHDRFPRDGTARFSYTSPSGPVLVRFDKWGDKVRATLVPAPEGSSEQEGAMGLISAQPSDAPMAESADALVTLNPEPLEIHDGPAMPIPRRGEFVALPVTAPAPAPAPSLRVLPASQPPPQTIPMAPAADAQAAMLQLLSVMLARRASDLHLSSENVPVYRIDGDITPDPEYRKLSSTRLKEMIFSITPERNREDWEKKKDTDFAYETDEARFRVNVFADRKGIGAVIRQIPNTIKTAEELGLSKALLDLCHLPKGLVLVTGPTGSGKSTTLAGMVDHINRTRSDHIITIEDPIEFVHPNRSCLVNQREVGVHTDSFKNALRAALREDPDVVLVGELRDLETIAIAIETAETGHLVFGTLHTNTAPSTVDRIIDQFPSDRQQQIRTMLSESLKGVVAQTLCKKIGGGRVAAQEIMICNGGVANLIREGKTFQLPSIMQTGKAHGMVTLNDALLDLVKRNLITPEEGIKKSVSKAEMRNAIERAGFKLEAAAGDTKAA